MLNSDKSLVGLITYHAAYNFGSALQAYATVKTIEKLGFDVETIDYRTPSQTFWYQVDFSRKKGIKHNLLNYGFFFLRNKRKERAKKFEDFILNNLKPTNKTFVCYEEINNEKLDYDILISGSDQIWNFNCGEFRFESKEAILPYFLKFGDEHIKRIAYASSFGGQSVESIREYKELLLKYNYLSTREPIIKNRIEEIIEKDINLVCDPTWLLSKEEWKNVPGLYNPHTARPYIFVYIFNWRRKVWKTWMKAIKSLANKKNMDVVCISPLVFNHFKGVKMLQDAGPLDFLSYLSNASLVVTTTFHGTIFSMNLEVPFFTCNAAPDSRQGQMLKMCGLQTRIISNPEQLSNNTNIICDFNRSSKIIESFRQSSKEYLKKALFN